MSPPAAARCPAAGDAFFDTFPLNEDPVREAARNVRVFKALWARAGALLHQDQAAPALEAAMQRHDALGAMEAVEEAEALLGRGEGAE